MKAKERKLSFSQGPTSNHLGLGMKALGLQKKQTQNNKSLSPEKVSRKGTR